MQLGDKIKELRLAGKLSQEKIAELLGVSRQAVSKWETGQALPTTENLVALAELFQVSVEELAHPGTRVALVPELKQGLDSMRKTSKVVLLSTVLFLLLLLASFIAALYGSFSGAYEESTVLKLVIVSAVCMLLAFVPIFLRILRFVYRDCKARGIRPGFWVLLSTTMLGLLYYLLRRDALSGRNYR